MMHKTHNKINIWQLFQSIAEPKANDWKVTNTFALF